MGIHKYSESSQVKPIILQHELGQWKSLDRHIITLYILVFVYVAVLPNHQPLYFKTLSSSCIMDTHLMNIFVVTHQIFVNPT